MQARHFQCCVLLFLAAVQLLDARSAGGGGSRGGRSGGFGGLFSGWFKSSKSSSSSSSTSSSSSSSSASSTSNRVAKSNHRSYTPYISRPYAGYRSMSHPSYNSGHNSGYNTGAGYSPYQSLDDDLYTGFSTGMHTTRLVDDLMQLLRMRLPNDDPDAITEEAFTIKPSDILEVERSMNISAWFNLIKPISDRIFDRMAGRPAHKHRVTTQVPVTTITTTMSQKEIKVASEEFEETGNVESVSEEDISTPIGLPIKTSSSPIPGIICVQKMDKNPHDLTKTIQNISQNCFTAPEIVDIFSTESFNDDSLAGITTGRIQSVTEIQALEQQSTVDAVASESLQPEPGKIFYVATDHNF